MIVRHIVPPALLSLLLLCAGCERATVAEQDARDRENPQIRNALEREQVGDLQGAIAAYETVLLDNPRLVSAHFHLALLLQDYSKDYMSAIYHYRQYERLRPVSEKTALLRERVRICQQLLVAQMLTSSDATVGRKQQELIAEIERLNARLSLAEGEGGALRAQKEALERQLAAQKTEVERLRRIVDRMGPGTSDDARPPRSILPRMNPASDAPPATPPHAVDAPAVPPPRITVPEPPPPRTTAPEPTPRTTALEPPPLLSPPEPVVTPENDAATIRPPAAPAAPAPRTYTVQPGDSIYRIAERMYNDPEQWKKIRDANKDHLGPGNTVRPGQVLIIP